MSAISGANVAEQPMPITRLARAKTVRPGAAADAMNASPSVSAAPATGRTMPKRSTSRPIITPPRPKPTMASV
jgi:hypothetical protein